MKIEKTNRKKQRVLRKQVQAENSIICGIHNPATLGCVFYELEGGGVGIRFTASRWHEGHGHMMHGGFIAAILDEVMGRAINNAGIPTTKPFVTAEMTTYFRCPIAVGAQMYAFGRVEKAEGRRCYSYGEIINEEGIIMAKATGTYVMVDKAGDDKSEDYDGIPTLPLEKEDPQEL